MCLLDTTHTCGQKENIFNHSLNMESKRPLLTAPHSTEVGVDHDLWQNGLAANPALLNVV